VAEDVTAGRMQTRRRWLRAILVGLVVHSSIPKAQAPPPRRIGVLSPGPSLPPTEYEAVWAPLRKLGWIEGRDLRFERRWADGRADRLQQLADELVALPVDLIVTIGTEATWAAKQATQRVPIVMLSTGDPVRSHLVASLSRPGGNITGISVLAGEVEAKRIALIREIVPDARRVAILVDPTTPIAGFVKDESAARYRAEHIEPLFIEVVSIEKLDEVLAEVAGRGVQALVVHDDILFRRNGEQVARAALAHRLPAIIEGSTALHAGGLLSYAVDEDYQLTRFASFVARILRGARPADLPIEQPIKFKLTINLNVARALGLEIPQSIILRADEVIR